VERINCDDWVSASTSFEVKGVRDKGRDRNTCDECMQKDLAE